MPRLTHFACIACVVSTFLVFVSGTTIRVVDNLAPVLSAASSVQARGVAPTSDIQLAWYDRSGKEIGKLGSPAPFIGASPGVLSPDGKRLAAVIGPQPDIWVIDLSDGSRRQLTTGGSSPSTPSIAWSPDGSRIVFGVRRGKPGLYVLPTDGSANENLLIEVENDIGPGMSWSPDNKFIVYATTAPGTAGDIWALPLTGDRKPLPILQTTLNEFGPQISPDGKWLAYRKGRTPRADAEIFVRPFPEGSGEWQISTETGYAVKWRGDSRELFFVKPGFAQLFSVELQVIGSSIQASVPRQLIPTFGGDYVVSPDGQRFLLLTR